MAAHERVIAVAAELVDGGDGVRFVVESGGSLVPAFAIRHCGVVHAYLNICAHQELELDWQPGAFFDADRVHLICSAHGALYEPGTGRCIAGPCAGGAIVRVPVREREDGAIVVGGEDD